MPSLGAEAALALAAVIGISDTIIIVANIKLINLFFMFFLLYLYWKHIILDFCSLFL